MARLLEDEGAWRSGSGPKARCHALRMRKGAAAAGSPDARENFDAEGEVGQTHAHGLEQRKIGRTRTMSRGRHEGGERADARPIIGKTPAELATQRLDGGDAVDGDGVDPVEDVLVKFLALRRDCADRVQMGAAAEHTD